MLVTLGLVVVEGTAALVVALAADVAGAAACVVVGATSPYVSGEVVAVWLVLGDALDILNSSHTPPKKTTRTTTTVAITLLMPL